MHAPENAPSLLVFTAHVPSLPQLVYGTSFPDSVSKSFSLGSFLLDAALYYVDEFSLSRHLSGFLFTRCPHQHSKVSGPEQADAEFP